MLLHHENLVYGSFVLSLQSLLHSLRLLYNYVMLIFVPGTAQMAFGDVVRCAKITCPQEIIVAVEHLAVRKVKNCLAGTLYRSLLTLAPRRCIKWGCVSTGCGPVIDAWTTTGAYNIAYVAVIFASLQHIRYFSSSSALAIEPFLWSVSFNENRLEMINLTIGFLWKIVTKCAFTNSAPEILLTARFFATRRSVSATRWPTVHGESVVSKLTTVGLVTLFRTALKTFWLTVQDHYYLHFIFSCFNKQLNVRQLNHLYFARCDSNIIHHLTYKLDRIFCVIFSLELLSLLFRSSWSLFPD